MRIILLLPILFISGFLLFKSNEVSPKSYSIEQTPFNKPADDFVKNKLSSMTLREKIAQMVISSTIPENFDENSAEFKKLKRLSEQTKVGGFIFFKGSSIDYARLSNKLQSFSQTPLLISADFERGTKMRVTDGAMFPNNMAIGATDNPELSYKMGLEVARETRLLGVHQNYAPVCDVNNNPNNPIINVRSFGEDPQLVSKMSAAMIKGLQQNKVIATAKHFPGHGDTEIDSHNDLPVLNFSLDRLNTIELVPFKNAIENNVMSVMIAHLSFPELESQVNVPASLSPAIVDGLLINKMGFNGLVVTDALNMKGITKYFSTSEVAVMCVEAGIDLILMPLDEDNTVDAIEAAVLNGRITKDRIEKSAEKILKTKEWLGLYENKYVQEADVWKTINTSGADELAQQIADESVTLVKDDNNALPLSKTDKIFIFTLSDGKDNINSAPFIDEVLSRNTNTNHLSYDSDISSGGMSDAMELASANDVIIVAIYAKVRHGTGKISVLPSHSNLISKLSDSGKKVVIISFGNPYLLKEFSSAPNYICAYGDSDVSITATAKAIFGEIKFKGKLPLTISDSYKYGSGINK